MKLSISPLFIAMLWGGAAAAANQIELGPPEPWVQPTAAPSLGQPTQTPVKVLLVDRQIRFSGRAEEMYVENVTEIQTAQGLNAIGTITILWNPDTDQVTVHKLQILRGAQHIDVLAGQKFIVARRESKLEYAALDGTLTGVIQPPGLQVGDVVDIAYTLRRADPVLAGTSEAVVGGLGNVAVSRVRIRAQWPTDQAIHWGASDGLIALQVQHGGLSWVNVDQDNLQPVVQPKDAPARYVVDPRVEFSSFASWGEVASLLTPLYEKAALIGPHSPLLAEIDRIRAASPDPKVRAAMALSLVESQVRYVFLGMNDGGLIPAQPDLTWSRRFGDCKAKTVLLIALLHALQIDATPVAVSTQLGALLPTRLPMVELFDHVLVRSVMGGKTYWLDGTRLGDASLDSLQVPYYHWALVLKPHGGDLVSLVPPPPTEPLTDTSIQIDATAGLSDPAPFHVETILRGDVGLLTKLRLENFAPNQLNDSLRQYWERLYTFVKVKTVSAAYDDRTASEHLLMDGVAQMDWSGDRYETDGLGVGYQADFGRQPGPHQDAPYAVAYPFYNRVIQTIRLPDDGIGFSAPGEDVDRTVAGIQFHRHASLTSGVFTGETTERSVAEEFPASEAQADEAALRDMAKATLYVKAPQGYSPTAADLAAGIPATTTITHSGGFTSRGNSLLDLQRYQDAIEDFNAALALDPKDATTLADRGISYAWLRDVAEGDRDLTNASRIDPHNQYVFHGRGLLAMGVGNPRAAIAAFGEALKIDPKDVFALQMRAQSDLSLGEARAALADLSKAIELAPKLASLYWYRAASLRVLKMNDDALQQAGLVIQADPGDATAYLVASQIYAMLGDSKKAREAVERSIQIKPTEQAYLTQAQERPSSDLAARRADLEAAVRLNPSSAQGLLRLAEADSESGDHVDGVSVATRAMSVVGETPELLTLRGVEYFKTGEIKRAEQDFAEAAIKAQNAQDLNNVCWRMAVADVKLDQALRLCDAAIRKSTGRDKATYFDSRGFVLLRLGRCKEAIAAYDSALAISPLKPTTLYGRGVCELRLGDKQNGTQDMHDGQVFSDGAVGVAFKRYGVSF